MKILNQIHNRAQEHKERSQIREGNLSKEIGEKIPAARGRIEGERKFPAEITIQHISRDKEI